MPHCGASRRAVSTRPPGPGSSRRRAVGPSTRGPPREGPGVRPRQAAHHSPDSHLPRRERSVPSDPARLSALRIRPVADRAAVGPIPRRRLARTTMGPMPRAHRDRHEGATRGPGCASGRPAGKESARHEHRYLARRPDRHVGRRDLRRPRAPRLPGHLVRPLPADAAGGREARPEGLSRQADRHRPLARAERTLQRHGRPDLHRRRCQGQGTGQDSRGRCRPPSSPRSTTRPS